MRVFIAIIAVLILSGCAEEPTMRIAHAGGGIGKATYTNSFEALNKSANLGFTLIEIDLNWTADGKVVCMHDWTDSPETVFGAKLASLPTLTEFDHLITDSKRYHPCTLNSLAIWMSDNPGVRIVTDFKGDNVLGLRTAASVLPDAATRVIPQVYDPKNFAKARELGYKDIIWTLYRFTGSDDEVIEKLKNIGSPFAVTMPVNRTTAGLPKRVSEMGIYTYTHTINSADKLEYFTGLGIDNVYTDFLPPKSK